MEAKLRRTEIMSMCQYIGGQTACLGAEGRKKSLYFDRNDRFLEN